MRSVLVFALLVAACDSGLVAGSDGGVDLSGDLSRDGGGDLSRDGGGDLASACAAQAGACDYPADQWCAPFGVGTEEVCFCTSPSRNWYCCHPEVWACPAQPREGDACCPSLAGPRPCGACTCLHAQFVCHVDGGSTD